jgi:hypothetical protein
MLVGPASARECAPQIFAQVDVAGRDYCSQERTLSFSEANSSWQAMPRWVEFLLKCGYVCADPTLSSRRVGLISMPCDSAGAGIVALGAMRRRLTVDQAHDSASHYQRIERLATKNSTDTFLRHNKQKGRFRLEGQDRKGLIWVRNDMGRLTARIAILPLSACDWHFDGEAPVQTIKGAELPHVDFYEALMNECPVLRSNLSLSDSGICLAGRVAGESVSKSTYADIRFQQHHNAADLSQLLTVQDWSPATISRVTFFNTRTRQLDRNTGLTRLVVADGDAAFLNVLENPEFNSSDVLGIIHRAVERERLEAIGFKIAELQQWYAPDVETRNFVQPVPSGITILAIRRR